MDDLETAGSHATGEGGIEASYPMSPMQQGMLVNHLQGAGSGVDLEQTICALREPLDAAAFERAWQRVVDRHPILRTAFRWRGLDEPRQEVRRRVVLPFERHDLRALPAPEAEARVEAYLREDRRRGFDLAEAPLTRCALFQLGEADHRCVWTVHHALLDGRSFLIVLKEVFAFHEAFSARRELELPLPRPFGDYLAWLARRDASASEAFWRRTLEGFRAPTPLPPGTPDPSSPGVGKRLARLPRATTAALQALAKANGLTVNNVVQGAWALLLGRYAGERDVVFGATRTCRGTALEREGTDAMVGLLINTLPMRVRLPPDLPVLAWLGELRAAWRALRDHEHTPLASVSAWSELPPRAPLFETMVVYEEYLLYTILEGQGGKWKDRSFLVREQPSFPLSLSGYGGEELLFRLHHDRERFDDAAADRILAHFCALLAGIVADPGARLADVTMTTEDERRRLLVTWCDTDAEVPRGVGVHQLFEAQAARTPEGVAVSCGGRTISYRALDARSNQLARHLRARGVGPEVPVAVCCERSIEMVIGLLGILKAGGAYVPLDPAYPRARSAAIVEDARATILVTQERTQGALSAHSMAVVLVEDEAIAAASSEPLLGPVPPDQLAYVIYTSGSTGRPKGVAIEHHSAVAMVAWANRAFSPAELEGVLFSTSICFDLSVFELFVPLAWGGRVIIAADLLELPSIPEAAQVTLIDTVPSAIAELLHAGGIPRSVRAVNLAGEPLSNALAQELYALPGIERVRNLYGPTEDTTYSTWTVVEKGSTAPVTIGRAVSNSRAYVLDARMRPAPIGVAGELHLAGEGVARGYLHRPELTAERFVPNPFGDGARARLYRTGDLARTRDDGELEFLGRIDQQVKVRGFRVELGEVEAVLGQHPAVRECVALARADAPSGLRIVAYVVPAAAPPDAADLRAFVGERLPSFMVPSAFVVLDRIPRTENGKVDHRALPAPAAEAAASREHVPPRSPEEIAVAELFEAVLGLPRGSVGLHDDFFEIGGQSLLAVRLFAQIERTFGKRLHLSTLSRAPTVQRLAHVLHHDRSGGFLLPVTPKSGSSKTPLFWCGQAFTEVARLARHLDPDQPVYSLESTYYLVTSPATHVEDYAARYTEAIQEVQPDGPYLLGGFCLDGVVAFEIARRLRALGQDVALLVLVDSSGPHRLLRGYQRIADDLHHLAASLASLAGRDAAGRRAYLVERLRSLGVSGLRAPIAGEPSAAPATEPDALHLARMARAVRLGYTPRGTYPGRTVMFFASDTIAAIPTRLFPRCGWERTITGPVEIHVVQADHDTIALEPSVGLWARELARHLERAQREVRGGGAAKRSA